MNNEDLNFHFRFLLAILSYALALESENQLLDEEVRNCQLEIAKLRAAADPSLLNDLPSQEQRYEENS
ncbi:hypothetical protein [Gloeobacter morelensis]|uniref:Uncharacterized protein n=1 Tax=Gloeobacter morelensis MG652769 TaxID=2781736 RepID=A0ABY3PQX9_9CYAN|nr:hypothetical protein [Gloeobacter morelensis]UFP95943.1 hypothetical protein ISF26_06910 [Gloeobacter morelensis MG652769]